MGEKESVETGEIDKREFTRGWRDCSVVKSVCEFVSIAVINIMAKSCLRKEGCISAYSCSLSEIVCHGRQAGRNSRQELR